MARPRAPIVDLDGRPFGALDFETAEHVEVVLEGAGPVRLARALFAPTAGPAAMRLGVPGDAVFLGKNVTTIDGIDLGRVVAVVRHPDARFEALVASGGGEDGRLAVPMGAVREVSAHIILEPSAEEIRAAQRDAARSPRIAAALARAAP